VLHNKQKTKFNAASFLEKKKKILRNSSHATNDFFYC